MKRYFFMSVLAAASAVCQASDFTIQTSSPRQNIRHFGASDAWSMQFIGLWENEAEQQKIADWLFSTKNDAQGKPLGIGLSIWRFNLGAGSEEPTKTASSTPKMMAAFTNCFQPWVRWPKVSSVTAPAARYITKSSMPLAQNTSSGSSETI